MTARQETTRQETTRQEPGGCTPLRGARPGEPFGGLPVPDGVDVLRLAAPAGALTALRAAPPAGTATRGTALLVPGFTGSKEDFYPLLPELAERGFDTWAFSQRGQADSVAPAGEEQYTLDCFAADAVDVAHLVLDSSGADRLHLLGHSFGGMTARAAALAKPRLFADLTMLCSGPHGWPGRKAPEEARLRAGGGRGLWELDNPELERIARRDETLLSVNDRYLRARSRATSTESLLGAITVLADPADPTPELAATGLPVLVAHGAHDLTAWPQEWQRRMAEQLGARHEVIAGAGHLPNQEATVPTADLLADFWSRT